MLNTTFFDPAGGGYDVKRRARLVVEGAAAPEVMATLPELDRLANELEKVRQATDLLQPSKTAIEKSKEKLQ